MTEDSSYSHVSTAEHNAPGYVGVPLPGVQVKLSDEGEVLIKSPGQCIGYYKQPELTAASFTEDGFFRTGDLGERTPDGLLKLTGRAKELFKTAKGKYVAPAPIENRINAHPMVELSLVSGVGQPAAYAMVILAEHLRPRMNEAEVRSEVEKEMHQLLQDVNGAVAGPRAAAHDRRRAGSVVDRERLPHADDEGAPRRASKRRWSRTSTSGTAWDDAFTGTERHGPLAASASATAAIASPTCCTRTACRSSSRWCGGHISPILVAAKARGIRIVDTRARGDRRVRRRCGGAPDRAARRRRGHGRSGADQHDHRAEERAARAEPGRADRRRRADGVAGSRRAAGHRPALARRAAREVRDARAAGARPRAGRRARRCARQRAASRGRCSSSARSTCCTTRR